MSKSSIADDVGALRLRELVGVERRAEQALLLTREPDEADLVARLDARAWPSAARPRSGSPCREPSSLMPGPSGTESRWAPEMTVRSVRPAVVSAITLRVGARGCVVADSATVAAGCVVQEAPGGVGRLERRDRDAVAADRAVDQPVALGVADRALVEDDHAGGAAVLRVLGLQPEVAGAALDQRDLAREARPGSRPPRSRRSTCSRSYVGSAKSIETSGASSRRRCPRRPSSRSPCSPPRRASAAGVATASAGASSSKTSAVNGCS